MGVCAACGTAYDDAPKFCPECGARISDPRSVAEERKVVTALFCDLVGFTALSESADPEDVDRMLTRYFTVARSSIEAYGGVVEKFIGDAVVGVFGVPAAHEDDPERAIRAALRITEEAEHLTSLDGGPLRLRVGINTGETLVRLGVAPGSGERFLAGDAINTASRIQSVAPVMGVAVGRSTYDATRMVFDYADLTPAVVKGKSEPVEVFHAVAPRARLGTDVTRVHDGPFVGREIDLALLKGVFDKTLASRAPQLVTVVGEPGMGKSRLVAELGRYVDTRPELVTWRQGRCLPYGDGITYWALSEVVKAHAGILDSDSPDEATAKLDAVLPGDQRDWYRLRLLPLLGISGPSVAEREELFAAWTGFVEHVADDAPTVLVLEDLHWADEPMLSFLEHLAARAEAVPLLIVGTARPELFEHHPTYGAGLRSATTITLSPLTDDETARLVTALLDVAAVPAEVQQAILGRAEGNPLYAEEYLRLLQDRGLLVETGASWSLSADDDVPLPSTVQALIAARIDTLTPDAKTLVSDAAVVGKVFWDGALVSMSELDAASVSDALHELTRRQLVKPSRQSSLAGAKEYAFWHALTRDVAYSQLPRAARARKHLAAMHWMEGSSAERLEDVSELLVHHATTALDASVAAGDAAGEAEARDAAFRYLTLAGERAHGLDTAVALAHLQKALLLAPDDNPSARAEARLRFAQIAFEAASFADCEAAYEEVVSEFAALGDRAQQARAMTGLARVAARIGDPRTWTLPFEALDLIAALPPGPAHVVVLSELCVTEAFLGHPERAVERADEAITLAAELGLPEPARAIAFRGGARCVLLDDGGFDDYQRAIEIADRAGAASDVAKYYNNWGCDAIGVHGARAALEPIQKGVEYARARGLDEAADCASVNLLDGLIDTGRPEEADDLIARLVDRFEASGNVFDLVVARLAQLRLAGLRHDFTGLDGIPEQVESLIRRSEDPRLVVQLGWVIPVYAGRGQVDLAVQRIQEMCELGPHAWRDPMVSVTLPTIARYAIALDVPSFTAEVLPTGATAPLVEHAVMAARALLSERSGDTWEAAVLFQDVAARWERFEMLPETAFALLGHGRCLTTVGRSDEGRASLHRAQELFQIYQARRPLHEIDQLLGTTALGA